MQTGHFFIEVLWQNIDFVLVLARRAVGIKLNLRQQQVKE